LARRSSKSSISGGLLANPSNFSDRSRTRLTERPSLSEVESNKEPQADINTAGVIIAVSIDKAVESSFIGG
jgi:hypothetical protein